MTTRAQFFARCRARHDFSDQLQVRYEHPDGERFDTWVSGEEVEKRLKRAGAEERLKLIRTLRREDLDQLRREAPDFARQELEDRLRGYVADEVEDFLGRSRLSAYLSDTLRDEADWDADDPRAAEKQHWQARLQDEAFRAIAFELAWINLQGSLPDSPPEEPDDWVS